MNSSSRSHKHALIVTQKKVLDVREEDYDVLDTRQNPRPHRITTQRSRDSGNSAK